MAAIDVLQYNALGKTFAVNPDAIPAIEDPNCVGTMSTLAPGVFCYGLRTLLKVHLG